MKLHHSHGRALRRIGGITLGSLLVISPLPAFQQQTPPPVPFGGTAQDLPQATIPSGISINDSFYQDLEGDVLGQNQGHKALYAAPDLYPYTDQMDASLQSIAAWLNSSYLDAINWIDVNLPILGDIIEFILMILGFICGSGQPNVDLGIPHNSVVKTFELSDLVMTQVSGGQQFDVALDDIGMLAVAEIDVSLPCDDMHDQGEILFAFPDATYRVNVNFLPGGGVTVTSNLLGALPALEHRFDGHNDVTATTLWSAANQTIGGVNLQQKLTTFATNEVPAHLIQIFTDWWQPYLTQPGSLLDLSGSKQNIRYGANSVAGTVGSAVFGPLQAASNPKKVRARFTNVHSVVPTDPIAICASGGDFVPGPVVSPDYSVEDPLAEGSYHTSYKTLEHRILAGIISGVGHRDEQKPLSPYVVKYPLGVFLPEAGNHTFQYLLTDPLSPILPIPLTRKQVTAILATPLPGGGTLGASTLAGFELRLRVCEVTRQAIANPLPAFDGDGFVLHDVVLEATIESGGIAVLQETFDASFLGGLRLSKVPNQDSTEVRTIRAELVTLVNQAGKDWTQIDSTTLLTQAPVSLFLRGFFGDNTVPTPPTDQRIHYMIEGLVGPLVERSAHGMVVLPGLDFPPFDGEEFGEEPNAEHYYDQDYPLGLDFNEPRFCAEVRRWGQTSALVGGLPSSTDFMLTVEVDWTKIVAGGSFYTSTVVSPIAQAGPHTPTVQLNPSRWDAGFLQVYYQPGTGDETRVMNTTGDRIGDFLPGPISGSHFVAATPFAYMALRQTYASTFFPTYTFELRPYRASASPPCATVFPGPLFVPSPLHPGMHHDSIFLPDIYEALTFETRKRCLGIGMCDGARVVALWTSPLFWDCPTNSVGVDYHTFNTVEGTLRVPPSSYVYQLESCNSEVEIIGQD